jgi:signal transduction histidine kinase
VSADDRERRPLILIVDDDPHIARSLSAMLGRCGYATVTATTGREALEVAEQDTVDGVLLDVRLPDLEGVDLIKPLKDVHPDVAIIMVTAYASVPSAIGALNRGASGYVTKPFAMDEVLVILQEGLEKQRLISENRRLLEEAGRELKERERVQQVLVESEAEEERARLAREIHDELGQQLTALKMELAWMRKRLPTSPALLREKAESMGMALDAAIHTVGRISSELRPGLLDDLGLAAAMEWQAAEFAKRTGIACEVDISSDDMAIRRELATALFRVYQEALTNVARHANAASVRISLGADGDTVTLEVQDDGRGITEEQVRSPASCGILGMRERLRPWNGTVEIGGARDAGTTVRVIAKIGDYEEKGRD